MPSPSTSLATLRPDLAGSFTEFDLAMSRQGFIAQRVMPVFEVPKQAGKFGRITLASLLRNRTTTRAPGSGYSRGNWKFTDDSFATVEHGAEEPVDDRESEMYVEYFDAEQVSADIAFDAVLRNAEQRVADAVFNATTFTPTTLTNEWDDLANATPIADVEAAVKRLWEATGIWANALVINRRVFRNLRRVTEIIDQSKSQGFMDVRAGMITEAQLATVFDLPNIVVAGSPKNTADEGLAATIAPIWSDEYAMICRIAETQNIKEPCLGRTFHWSEDGSQIGGTVETYREEPIRGEIVRVRHDVDEKMLYTAAGELLDNVTT